MAGRCDETGAGVKAEDPPGCLDAAIARALLDWYDRHARDLPWRLPPAARRSGARPDPYRVWLSEVMLQQTTVAAVKPFFARFLATWPSVLALARADEAAVMAAWAGLGYYSRARNLHACAKAVAARPDGAFPASRDALLALPGIGAYTAAAVAAIAFDEPAAVVDGNVERVTARLLAIETPFPKARERVRAAVAAAVPADRPGDFAQAMMDLGATVCTPRSPACVICPVRGACRAAAEGRQTAFPVKAAKRAKPRRVGAAFVAVRPGDGAVRLRRRPAAGLLGGMSEPFTTGWSAKGDGATGAAAAPFPADWRLAGTVAHGFTHFDLELEVWRAETAAPPGGDGGWWAPADRLDTEALPSLMRAVIARALASPGETPAMAEATPAPRLRR